MFRMLENDLDDPMNPSFLLDVPEYDSEITTTAAPSDDHGAYAAPRPMVHRQRRLTYTPYQNQSGVPSSVNRRYVIGTPRPGQLPKQFPGLDYIRDMHRKIAQERRVTVVPPVEDTLIGDSTLLISQPIRSSGTRFLLKIPKREEEIQPPSYMLKDECNDNDVVRWNMPTEILYTCPDHNCYWKGSTQASLTRHIRTRHPELVAANHPVDGPSSSSSTSKPAQPPKRAAGVRCSECDNVVYSRALLLKHMGTAHGISIPPFSRIFNSERELTDWLSDVRDAFCVDYVTGSGPKLWSSGARITYLLCSRSGDMKERPNKKFCRPVRQSIKCGKTCSAYLKMRKCENDDPNGPLTVEGCLYHTGHSLDPRRIRLTGEEMDAVWRVATRFGDMCAAYPVENIRELLGVNQARFRLIADDHLMEILPEWVKMVVNLPWKFKAGVRTDADLLADTMLYTAHADPYNRNTTAADDSYNHHYAILDEEILHYADSENAGSDQEGSINVTDDFSINV